VTPVGLWHGRRVHAHARIAGLVLAAGRSTRMGRNKLLCSYAGAPLVAHAVDAALGAGLEPVHVVTGHEQEEVRAVLADRGLTFVYNPGFAQGMASSLRVGLLQLWNSCDAAVVLLGDMPRVRAEHVRGLVEAFAAPPRAICVPEYAGRRGNPVLWPASKFGALVTLHGDVGGRGLLEMYADEVRRVPMPDDGVLYDVDEPTLLEPATMEPDR
jgi:molybdenum cofactor cytidylyltransferase